MLDRRARLRADTLSIVYGEAAHTVLEQEAVAYQRAPPRQISVVKAIKGPSVTAGVFYDVLDAKSKQPTQPQPHEVGALHLRVDPDAAEAGEAEL